MTAFFDTLETRTPDNREAALLNALPRQIAHAQTFASAFAQLLVAVDAESVTSRAALAHLPVTRKSQLHELQKAGRPNDDF